MPQGIKWIMDTRSNYLLVRALGHLNDNTLQCDHLPIRKVLPPKKTVLLPSIFGTPDFPVLETNYLSRVHTNFLAFFFYLLQRVLFHSSVQNDRKESNYAINAIQHIPRPTSFVHVHEIKARESHISKR